MEIKDIQKNLDKIRGSKDMWKEFEYSDPDINYMKRYALAIALQYDNRQEDKELIKFLMENEVESRINDPYQGVGDSLNLISYLLAKFKEVENVWLFDKAKSANFDTALGYNSEFIFSAGVEVTCDYLEKKGLTEENYLYEYRDELHDLFTEGDIEKFLARMKLWFPESIKEESVQTLFRRAVEFEDCTEAERLFGLMEQDEENDASTLYHCAKDIKNYEKAIYYKRIVLGEADTAWDKVSALESIAEMYLLNGDLLNAFETAKKWDSMLSEFDRWKDTGLGRMLTEIWFDICLGFIKLNDIELANDCFLNGDKMINTIKYYHLNMLEKANDCCNRLGISEKYGFYMRLLEKERKRVEEMLK
ncbi:hypothetical protein [Pseudobacteroides cellulosolvens]|uniref:Uncharacterized protein n=1 Tax=Pseudobacteroides cellulosolvens ATCC 35603 = DSM 2933 TaxID=398512 RepID=A0A0L6JM81_9FIRM|nr:hypothetical protein [Pseudobacteroides cellulosolvens]KNY26906.1 hypothetical protein Bccel_2171 [Pseudobacteroides cellulosolvens ATCC 35603 = DSM 2933]